VTLALPSATLLLACGACGGGPDKTLEKVSSWAATAHMLGERRAEGATSARYTSNALHVAHAELLAASQSLRTALDSSKDSSALAPDARGRALDVAESITTTVAAMAGAADAFPHDAGAPSRVSGSLVWDEQVAQALADSAKGK